jgi:cobalt/nickel transport system permease protein
MRHDFLDRYSRIKSPVHRLPASAKLLVAAAVLISVVGFPAGTRVVFPAILIFLLAIAFVSRIPWRFIVGRLLLLEPFALGIALLSLLQHNGEEIFLTILMKSSLCLLTMILASNTTPFSEVLQSLRSAGVPSILITVLALAYRYLFVLIDEGERIQRARRSRTFGHSKGRSWYSLSTLVGELFVRSTERAERIYTAMTSRGWK